MNISRLLTATALVSASFAVPHLAYAQESQQSDESAEEASASAGEVLVTGSRIRRDEQSGIEPITVISKSEMTQAGFASATDALQSAEVTAGSSQINNFYAGYVTDGGTGANTLGLRNLGPARTLILLNGRRVAPAGTRGSVMAADLNVLPGAIIDSIEVLKAGASSVYGSDAVAGVVNIITDQKLRGLTLEAQTNIPEAGAGIDRKISASFGFESDRLSVIGSLEYRKRDALTLGDRGFTSCPIPGYRADPDSPIGSDDPFPLGDPRNCWTIDNGGVTINTLGLPTRQAIGRTSGTLGNYNRFVPDASITTGTPGYAGVGTYDRDSFDPEMLKEELITPVQTYTGFLSTKYQLDGLGNAEIYAELLANRRQSSSKMYRQLSIDYLQGSLLLPTEFRNGIFLAPNNVSSGQNVAARAFVGFGLTDTVQSVDYVRFGAGIRGDFFFDGWRYDVYAGKSWTDGRYDIESFLIDRMAASMDVVAAPGGGFQCRTLATNANCVAAPALSADVIGGVLPQAWRDYILANTVGYTKFREGTFIASVDGPIFRLPGGDAQLAIGVEYREQEIDDSPDEHSINGNLLGLTAGLPTRGKDNVKEAFAEVYLPILSDTPFFHNLNLNASIRYTDYASYGSDYTYKVAGEWSIVKGFGFRGSYGTSYRAPALAEQFLGETSGFLSAANDPCDMDRFPRANGAPNPSAYSVTQQQIAANCASIGIDVGTFKQNNGITSFSRGGAATGLSAETSTNWSLGAVLKPRISATTSFALAVDYFDIKVSNGVSQIGSTTILSRCYSDISFNPNDGFCRFVSRDANNILTVTSGYVNLAVDVVKGYEASARFATEVFGGRLTVNAGLTKYTEQSDKTFPEEILLDSSGTLNNPDWVGNVDASFRRGKVTARWGMTWFDASSGTAEYLATSRTTGLINQATLDTLNQYYIVEAPAYFLHNASVQFAVTEKFKLTAGVRNLFDTDPPKITAYYSTVGNAPLYSGYDYTGRQFFVNTTFKF